MTSSGPSSRLRAKARAELELRQRARAADPARLLADAGMAPDPWQATFLRSRARRVLLLCARQCGKSTATSALALHTALYQAGALVLLLSPSERQSGELFAKVKGLWQDLGRPEGPSQKDSATELSLANGSRVVSLPGNPKTIRGFSAPRLLVVDEAALSTDELFVAVSPMLAVSGGRMVALSTPFGKRGWFFEAYESGDGTWERHRATAYDCPRVPRDYLDAERARVGERAFSQEYMCDFVDTVDAYFGAEDIAALFDRPPEGEGLDLEGLTY
jgi:hypothetical protein